MHFIVHYRVTDSGLVIFGVWQVFNVSLSLDVFVNSYSDFFKSAQDWLKQDLLDSDFITNIIISYHCLLT